MANGPFIAILAIRGWPSPARLLYPIGNRQGRRTDARTTLDLIGTTPLVALDRVHDGPGRVVARAEFMQPGGSVKDRAAKAILLAARVDGRLPPGGTVVEMTSGNMGDCAEREHASALMDAMLAGFLPRWRETDYEAIVTADHGQSQRGHHGCTGEDQRAFALSYFGPASGPAPDAVLDQLALAPTVLHRLGRPSPTPWRSRLPVRLERPRRCS